MSMQPLPRNPTRMGASLGSSNMFKACPRGANPDHHKALEEHGWKHTGRIREGKTVAHEYAHPSGHLAWHEGGKTQVWAGNLKSADVIHIRDHKQLASHLKRLNEINKDLFKAKAAPKGVHPDHHAVLEKHGFKYSGPSSYLGRGHYEYDHPDHDTVVTHHGPSNTTTVVHGDHYSNHSHAASLDRALFKVRGKK